jgi:acyl-CoA synthetase (AMP-forming)/AMP-acid ligase II
LEIESVILEHPAVKECCVLGLPHPNESVGEQIACVYAGSVNDQELKTFLLKQLSEYKVPQVWH